MDQLIKQLTAQVLSSKAVEIKHSALWALPVSLLDVQFKKVKQAKMDILMKMLLLTFEETNIRRAAQAAELLLVEELFIADLIEKMQRTGLIQMGEKGLKLTAKGKSQLAQGVIEEEQPEEQAALFYSPVHDDYWPAAKAAGEPLPLYRYVKEKQPDAARVLEILAKEKNTLEQNGFYTVVSEITQLTEKAREQVPAVEFQVYNKEQDFFYARVWNAAIGGWDKQLEAQIEENELPDWRKREEQAELNK